MASESLQAILGPDPAAVVASAFLAANAAGAVAIAVVGLARLPIRALIGPSAAYNLWLIPPLAAVATPILVLVGQGSDPLSASLPVGLPMGVVAPVWALGVLALAGVFAIAQARFMAEVRAGRAGPAVIGLIAPRIVLPAEDSGYTAQEPSATPPRRSPPPASACAGSTRWCTWPPTSCDWTRSWPATPP